MCECCKKQADRDRAMWLGIARALVQVTRGITGIANAIQRRYDEPEHRKAA